MTLFSAYNIHLKNCVESDWLRAVLNTVQKRGNMMQKEGNKMKISQRIENCDWLINSRNI